MRMWRYIMPRGPLAVGFDDDCGICQASKRWVAPLLPAGHEISLDSAQEPADRRLAEVDLAARTARLHAAEGERVLAGFAAVSALLRRTVVGPPLAPALAVLEFSGLGEVLYDAVAKHRGRACRVVSPD